MGRFNQQNNFIYLVSALLVLLFVTPLVPIMPSGFSYWILKLVTAGTIVVTYLSLNFGPVWRRLNLSLLAILLVSSLLRSVSDWQSPALFDLAFTLIFFLAVALAAGSRVLLQGAVDANKIVGAIAVYLLLGLVWSTAYLILLEISPTAFVGMEHMAWEENFSRSTYFSYVTLTTLGYGDISPAEPLSRVLVYLEAMVGTFYMAIVIASLIGARKAK